VVASDIGTRTLVMNNIMPAPICRYLKVRQKTRIHFFLNLGSHLSKMFTLGTKQSSHSCLNPSSWGPEISVCLSETVVCLRQFIGIVLLRSRNSLAA
jgi:hypothetical protein